MTDPNSTPSSSSTSPSVSAAASVSAVHPPPTTTTAELPDDDKLHSPRRLSHHPHIHPHGHHLPVEGCVTITNAVGYVLSGCSQPLLTTLIHEAGMADPTTQIYMLFYYLFPSCFILEPIYNNTWPKNRSTVLKAVGIAIWDIGSTSLNYTGASLAGPTIFAIIYSSVTVWTAVYSQLFLKRYLNAWQWMFVVVVFGGLTLTATDSFQLGEGVLQGSIMVFGGASMHGLTYVMSEAIMTRGDDRLSVQQNTGIQASVAASCFLLWQIVYTIPNWNEKVTMPIEQAGVSGWYALSLLVAFGLVNVIHSITFFHTLLHFPGGATSAGVMKGLQAVLVFVFTHFAYCGKIGGNEMCFTQTKCVSLITVCGGVLGYGYATQRAHSPPPHSHSHSHPSPLSAPGKGTTRRSDSRVDGAVEIEPLETTGLLVRSGSADIRR